jgi:hypothetical protein
MAEGVADRERRLRWLTPALGGRAGARLAERLGLLASRSTLLRELHYRRPQALVRAPRVLGIDDWAWRKGHRYGTILCDLETRKVIDLLPDRNANTVAAWLRQHPGTEIISRDRGGIYAEAVQSPGAKAVSLADPPANNGEPSLQIVSSDEAVTDQGPRKLPRTSPDKTKSQ